MAKIELSKDINGITLEASYFFSGLIVIFFAVLVCVPAVMDLKLPTTRMVPT